MSDKLIHTDNVHYIYGKDSRAPVHALHGIDLHIARGEYVVIVGHNGSGKSTLAKCLSGLLIPTEGNVWVEDKNTRQCAEQGTLLDIRATVGIVFQNPENQFVTTTVQEETAFGPENLGVPRSELRKRVDQALKDTNLSALKDRNPHDLSAGQKSRLAIASILAMRPTCLILDEATAMLDPLSRHNVLELLEDLHGRGLTMVVITHSMDEVVAADRVLVLDKGRIALRGTPHSIFAQDDLLQQLGLRLPPSAAIAQGLRQRGLDLPNGILTQAELVQALKELMRVKA